MIGERNIERFWEYVVALDFWTFHNPSDEKIATAFLDILTKFGFQPSKYGDQDPPKKRFDPLSRDKVVHEWVKHPGQLILERLGENGFQALLHLSQAQNRPVLITFALPDNYFGSANNVSKFLEFSEELYALFRPFQGNIAHKKDWDDKTVAIAPIKIGERTIKAEVHNSPQPTKGLPGIFWANYLGPDYVHLYSKDKVESVPSYSKKELADGGYLILTSPSPLDYAKPETKKIEQDIIEYLGRDAVFDKTLPDRPLRSPFLNRNESYTPTAKSPLPSSMSSNLRACPECGEEKRTVETSKDRTNKLVGFKCLNCGAIWAVHTSLLRAPGRSFSRRLRRTIE